MLLLLLTPQLLNATDAGGALRVADPNDPVRREFAKALDAGATVIPLLCDGVEAAPPAAQLAPPFDRLGDFTWRKLRAYDWTSDLARLESDLDALGILPRDAAAASTHPDDGSAIGGRADTAVTTAGRSATAAAGIGSVGAAASPTPGRRALRIAFVGVAAAALLALGAVVALRATRPPAAGPDIASSAASAPIALVATGLPGTWLATVDADPPFALTLQQRDDQVSLTSEPMPIDARAGWAPYRAFWLRLTGTELRSVLYRGRGTVQQPSGQPLQIDLAWALFDGTGATKIDSGNLQARAAPDGRSLGGTLWSNGDQATRPIVLRRPR